MTLVRAFNVALWVQSGALTGADFAVKALVPHLDTYAKILRALTRDAGDSCARLTMPRLR